MTDLAKPPQPAPRLSPARAILLEPLFHFLILGTLLFVLYSVMGRDTTAAPQRIVVSAGKIEHLSSIFSRTWQRQPTTEELRAIIDDYVREEVAYREGMKLGLDQDDTIIRRRIRQKVDFIADDLANQVEPSDEQLTHYLETHPEPYRVNTRVSFRQIYLDPDRHGEGLNEQVSAILRKLETDPSADASQLGDSTLLEHQSHDLPLREVAGLFGDPFSERLASMVLNQWHGPIPSAYGIHIVRVEERVDGYLPPLSEVRARVHRDWEQSRRQELVESFYQGLLKRYAIEIDWPEVATEEP